MRKKIGFIVISLILIVVIYNLIVRIYSAMKAGDRFTQAVEKLNRIEVKNKELKKQLTEVVSPAYIEKEARDRLGLARDGEVVLVIPEEKIRQVLGISKDDQQEERLANWLGWLRLFFK